MLQPVDVKRGCIVKVYNANALQENPGVSLVRYAVNKVLQMVNAVLYAVRSASAISMIA